MEWGLHPDLIFILPNRMAAPWNNLPKEIALATTVN